MLSTLVPAVGVLPRSPAGSSGTRSRARFPTHKSMSAAGLLALLAEDDVQFKVHALQQLEGLIDAYWPEVTDYLAQIEALSEDASFSSRTLASLVASKCYYHLEEYGDAVRLALGAGDLLDLGKTSEYTERIVGQCIDEYTAARSPPPAKLGEAAAAEDEDGVAAGAGDVDPRLEAVVNRMFDRCIADAEYTQAIGIALEARRLDVVRRCITTAGEEGGAADAYGLLQYTFETSKTAVSSRGFRNRVVQVLVELYKSVEEEGAGVDFLSLCRCLEYQEDGAAVAGIIESLVQEGTVEEGAEATADQEASLLTAYQIAFDSVENDNQKFLNDVRKALDGKPNMDGIINVLKGSVTQNLYLHFMYRHCKADPLRMKAIKDSQERHNPVLHHAAVVAHGYMHAGTTVDDFLRKNLDWLGKATHWAKFSATAAQGVVHKGHLENAMTLLGPYLPNEPGMPTGSAYVEGGALYALGLIHANRGIAAAGGDAAGGAGSGQVIQYLSNAATSTQNEVIHHGACLGLGLAAMATGNDGVYAQLRDTLFQDSAVAGEAAGLAMGLVLLGRGPEWRSDITGESAVEELVTYAHDTQHEKTIRGIALGLAFVSFGLEEKADMMLDELCRDKDPVMRYGGMYGIGMAYCGSANNRAIRRLLHVAVSDVSDDVRRAAVTNLGFLLFRTPERLPRLISLLTESYNPHVRYGAAMALGIACAGTGMREALRLLKVLADDAKDFVVQAALLAQAMVCQQHTEATCPEVKEIREKYTKLMTDKHTPTMSKIGAICAQGIIDAGGRNAVIALQSRAGFTRMPAVVGLAVWLQHWYWFPLMHFMSLSLAPTALAGLNKDLAIPKDPFARCETKPSVYAYPEMLKAEQKEKKERVATVELSTTAKAKAKKARKKGKGKGKGKEGAEGAGAGAGKSSGMEVEDASGAAAGSGAGVEEAKKEQSEPEPEFFDLENPCRVTPSQQSKVVFLKTGRYVPVRRDLSANLGVVMLRNTRPGEEEEVEEIRAPRPGEGSDDGPEPEAPEPFLWLPPEYMEGESRPEGQGEPAPAN